MAKNDREEFIKKHPNVVSRTYPHSDEAETAVIGGIIMNVDTATEYMPKLSAEDFYLPPHRDIFAAMQALYVESTPIDFVTLVQKLDALGSLARCGGVDYISKILTELPSTANTEYYFKTLKKTSELRAVIEIAKKMADKAYALDPDGDAIESAQSELYSLVDSGQRGKPELINKYIKEALSDLKARQEDRDAYRGVPTGFKYLDTMLGGGFQKSDLIILAARPGQGKTSFAMNCAVNAALKTRPDNKQPYSVAVFSLEMSSVQIAKRVLCSVGNFDMSRANRAQIDEMGWAKLYGAESRFNGTKLYIDQKSATTPAEILSKCRQLKLTQGLDFVLIDYLQLMHSGKNINNIVQEIGSITRDLKLAAKELNVPILLLSQMSRSIEKRDDPTPQLSDLRDSGAIEQDADIVLFLDRTAKTANVENPADDAGSTVEGNTVYLNVAKHRNGETGAVKMVWVPSTVTFKCVGEAHAEPQGGSGKGKFVSDADGGRPDPRGYETDIGLEEE